jgi:hypothetical protein
MRNSSRSRQKDNSKATEAPLGSVAKGGKKRKETRDRVDAGRLLAKHLPKLKAASPPPQYDIYQFLEATNRLGRKLQKFDKQTINRHLRKFEAHKPRRRETGLLIRLVDLTVGKHVKPAMRSKYAHTLEFCQFHNVRSKALKAFVLRQGGINTCVDKNRRRTRPRRR